MYHIIQYTAALANIVYSMAVLETLGVAVTLPKTYKKTCLLNKRAGSTNNPKIECDITAGL